ncbi:hypothetical protein [Formosa sp. S-31]|uniref:hypothetical protein n=1 Tax=Formosa sp. S-31 TaxID=2790949 RepID=UPI003EBDD1F5
MKKLLVICIAFLGFTIQTYAQHKYRMQEGLRIGGHIGAPMRDVTDISKLNFGADVSYLVQVTHVFAVGGASGFTQFTGKEVGLDGLNLKYDNFSFLPIAVSGRGKFGEKIFFSIDFGYAVGFQDDLDSGIYYQSKVGWHNGFIDLFAYYKGINAASERVVSVDNVAAIGGGIAVRLNRFIK